MYASDRDNRISISSMSRLTNKQSIIDILPIAEGKTLASRILFKKLFPELGLIFGIRLYE